MAHRKKKWHEQIFFTQFLFTPGRDHDNFHDDMNMSLIMYDKCLFIAMINISYPMINSLS